jgi:anaerobic ribonucleoside-triphosphate reductase activating protein
MTKIRIAGIITDSIVDGPGVRYTIFTQGCSHKCAGCHNPKTWDYNGGTLVEIDKIIKEIESLKYIKDITFSGGEPFDQPEPLTEMSGILKNKGYNILSFSGYTYEQLLNDSKKLKALQYIDILVDGRFEIKLKSLSLKFRGSVNQRIINVQESLKANQVVLIDEYM